MNKHNILFVDDDPAQRGEFKALFGGPYNVLLAADRNEALDRLDHYRHPRKRPIEDSTRLLALVVIDQRLEDFNKSVFPNDWKGAEGMTLITYIKTQICPPTRVVIRTAHFATHDNLGHQSAKLGADGYWPKSMPDVKDEEQWLRDKVQGEIDEFEDAVRRYNRGLQIAGVNA